MKIDQVSKIKKLLLVISHVFLIILVSIYIDGVHITNESEEGLWIIVKQNENMYKLSPNDIVKFGRVEYTIREIKTGEIGDVETDTEFEIEDIPEEREEEPR